jgi:hypothetical protein
MEDLERRSIVTTTTIQNNNHSAVLVLALATTIIPSMYWKDMEQSPMLCTEAIASFVPKAKTGMFRATSPVTAQEMIARLRKEGLPISAIADAMRVERKSIYSWLNGGEMRIAKTKRAAQLHSLFTGIAGVNARGFYRFWNTPVDGQNTLHDLIVADNINEAAAAAALNKLHPAALRAMETERRMARQGTGNPAVDDLPEAGVNA